MKSAASAVPSSRITESIMASALLGGQIPEKSAHSRNLRTTLSIAIVVSGPSTSR